LAPPYFAISAKPIWFLKLFPDHGYTNKVQTIINRLRRFTMQQPTHTHPDTDSIYPLARLRAHQLRQEAYAQCWASLGRVLGDMLQHIRPTTATGQGPSTHVLEA
jgi:hypothetical protein